jgi:nucleotide-binding universal stress UspA family protein
MALNDILLHIDSYPEATPRAAIDQAVGFVAALGGTISALAVTVTIDVRSNRVADYLIHLSDMAHEQEAQSLAACQDSLAYFRSQAEAADIFGQASLETADLYLMSDRVALRARTRDLTIIPLAGPYDGQIEVVESVIFSSGRPVVVFRAGESSLSPLTPAKVVVAWDGSRGAARALADALPILKLASSVRILTILNEKPATVAGVSADVVRHLAAHGVSAEVDEVDAKGRSIGQVLDAYIAAQQPDLLVMGAYGHSRLREFILGGATEHMLRSPKAPLFLSH